MFVIFGHTYVTDYCTFWFDCFYMALFFFLSGRVFRYYGSFSMFVKKKVRALLIPYVFWAMTITVYRTLLNTRVGIGEFQFKDIVIGFLLNIRYSHLWFLTCMFVATISFWIIEWFVERFQLRRNVFMIGLSISSYILEILYREYINVELVWNIDLVPMAICFMRLGVRAQERNFEDWLYSKKHWLGGDYSSHYC